MSVQFCCLARTPGEVAPVVPTFLQYTPRLLSIQHVLAGAHVVMRGESEQMAASLLEAGAARVFLGEPALREAAALRRLLARFGPARVALHVPVQRQAVSWSFETESNADFRVVTPSLCEPTWEVLTVDGQPSGVRAAAWIREMVELGVQTVLLQADICDDADLNLSAGMVEMLGSKLWLAPLHDTAAPIADWIRYGQATQIALPTALYHRRHDFLPRRGGASTTALGEQA